MPRSVDEGFRDFLTTLTPSFSESKAAKSHRASIQSCLENSFEMTTFFRTGSFGFGTSISGFSDVDYFAEIPTRNLKKNSGATLRQLREALEYTFHSTDVYVDSPAVIVPFGSNLEETTEIVPADYIETNKYGRRIYEIPDGSGGWKKASPDAHKAYVQRADEKLYKKVKPLIRFIKAWKYFRDVPISSFYLELRTTEFIRNDEAVLYSMDVKRVLRHLYDCGLAKMEDPMGISGYIEASKSSSSLDDAYSKLERALIRAEKAYDAEQGGDIKEAFDFWQLVFADQFPSYYR